MSSNIWTLNPIVQTPRNPPEEAVGNLLFVLENVGSDPLADNNFGAAFVREYHSGAFEGTPDMLPALSVHVDNWTGHEQKSLGLNGAHVEYLVQCIVTYYQGVAGKEVEDIQVTKNLWRLFDLIEYRNDINGLCPRNRAKPTYVQQSRSMSFPGSVSDYYVGGTIRVDIPIVAHRSFFNAGQTPRDLRMVSGARH